MMFGGIALNEGLLGGYEIINKPVTSLPQDLASALPELNSALLGATYDPIWLIGSQVVKGINYLLLCREIRCTKDAKPMIVALVVNVPPKGEGKAKIVKIVESADLPEDINNAFETATKSLCGVGYKAVAYIGSQVVKGTNHLFLCEARPLCLAAEPYPVILCINVFNGVVSVVYIERIGEASDRLGYSFTW